MKIINLHVENFGKLHDYDLEFNDNLVQIYHNNGWGKTSLTFFIKAIFYGLPAKSRGDEVKYERSKYLPWQGGNYGGYIEYEEENERYRITRYFGKTPEDDFYELINLTSGKVDKNEKIPLGEKLFGVGENSFTITAFFPQLNFKSGHNYDIAAHLSGANKYQDDLDKIQIALKSLKERKNFIKRQIIKLEQIEEHKSEINSYNAAINQLNQEIFSLEKDLERENLALDKAKENLAASKEKFDLQNKMYLQKSKISEKLMAKDEQLKSLNEKYINLTQQKHGKNRYALPVSLLCIGIAVVFLMLSIFGLLDWLVGGISIGAVAILITFLFLIYFKKGDKTLLDKNKLLDDIERIKKESQEIKNLFQDIDLTLPDHSMIDEESDKLNAISFETQKISNEIKLKLQDKDEYIEKIDNLQTLVCSMQQKREEDNKKIYLLDKTIEYLEQAKENVSQRFVAPLNQDFQKIFRKFGLAKDYIIDYNLNIFEKTSFGSKMFDYSSQGERDIISFCQRLSLIPKVYTKSKPIIILDDTFVNLDDNMLKVALNIVKEFSNSYQILYVCSNSRCKI